MTNREKLRKWLIDTMERHHLSDADVAQLVHGSVHRVRAWRRMPDTKGGNPIPMWAVELIALKLALNHNGECAGAEHVANTIFMPKSLQIGTDLHKLELGKREDT